MMKRVMNVTLIECRVLLNAMLLMELLDCLMCTAVVRMVNTTFELVLFHLKHYISSNGCILEISFRKPNLHITCYLFIII
jgi:hypothetical protein